mmetsp:Transcript_33015/g.99518  ORF Transcript_33015/g.99518 Transcript_33015/m.99518 type:complete len:237 (-) Transcript_33015:101-811(-)
MRLCTTRSAEWPRGGACLNDRSSKTHATRAPPATETAGKTSPRMRVTSPASSASPLRENVKFGSSAWPNATPMTSPAAAFASVAASAQLFSPSPSAPDKAPPFNPRHTPSRKSPAASTRISQYAASCSMAVDARAMPSPPTTPLSTSTSGPRVSSVTRDGAAISTPPSSPPAPPRQQQQRKLIAAETARAIHARADLGSRRLLYSPGQPRPSEKIGRASTRGVSKHKPGAFELTLS